MVTFLTKSTGFLGPIASLLGLIMNGIYNFFHFFGIQNIALSIVIFTFIVKVLMLPLNIKQQKFTKLSSRMNPELQKINAKYKGKTDEASLRKSRAETQAVYEKYGASPTAGCLPMLITLPIMFALYRVIYNIPAYVSKVYDLYHPIADAINNTNGFASALSDMAAQVGLRNATFESTDKIIDVLAKFKTVNWVELQNNPVFKDIVPTITENLPKITNVNQFFGLNISDAPGLHFPAILIPIIAMVLNFVQSKQIQVKTQDNKDNPTANMMGSMNIIMPIMSGVFCIGFPIGVGIYWIATSVFTIIQQYFVNKYMDRMDMDELIERSVARASKKKSKVSKVMGGATLEELAKKQTKSIESVTKSKDKSTELNDDSMMKEEEELPEGLQSKSKTSNNPNSISEIANLLKNRSNEKGDK